MGFLFQTSGCPGRVTTENAVSDRLRVRLTYGLYGLYIVSYLRYLVSNNIFLLDFLFYNGVALKKAVFKLDFLFVNGFKKSRLNTEVSLTALYS